jgi:IS1 family transposase
MLDKCRRRYYIKTMNRLSLEDRAKLIGMLVEGTSLRSATRLSGVSINTVSKLLVDVGTACAKYHDQHVRNLTSKRVQCDEIWAFVYAKQKNVPEEARGLGMGDVWTWTALDADSKLMISYLVGGRDSGYAFEFMNDVASRLTNRVQMTTDGHKPYLEAVEGAFGADIDYAMLVKIYGADREGESRYSPPECIGAKQRVVTGNPDKRHISTSYIERQNLTLRMMNRRFTRLTNAFSKKIENHKHSVALHFMRYNFCRIHKTLRCTPAMEAGVTGKVWEIEDIVNLIG